MSIFINIYSKGKYPADALSNFALHSFQFDGDDMLCMESLLQSLKFKDPNAQKQIWNLSPKTAKRIGGEQEWNTYLFWKGREVHRFSKEYTCFLESAYQCMCDQNPEFREALKISKGRILLHTIGKWRRSKTILTWWEFTHILSNLRKRL